MKTLACKNGPVATMEIVDQEVGDVIGQHSAGLRPTTLQCMKASEYGERSW